MSANINNNIKVNIVRDNNQTLNKYLYHDNDSHTRGRNDWDHQYGKGYGGRREHDGRYQQRHWQRYVYAWDGRSP